jgi:hypothetical protein
MSSNETRTACSCSRCGRTLTSPKAVKMKMGATCYAKWVRETQEERKPKQTDLFK